MREHGRSRRRLSFRVLTSIGLLSRVTITISLPVYPSQSVAYSEKAFPIDPPCTSPLQPTMSKNVLSYLENQIII